MNDSFNGPHRRFNPLLEEWVLCSPHRLERPWQGQTDDPSRERRPEYESGCYLCPGNRRANGETNPAYPATYVFDNDYPALKCDGPVASVDEDGLLVATETGRCRVICFSPRHDLTLAEMTPQEIRRLVDCWADEVATLGNDPRIRYVQLFENKGAMMGCSNPHPHCQVWATQTIPHLPSRKLVTQKAFFEKHKTDLLGAYLQRELERDERIVFRNDHFVVLVPFWAVWPFETMILPVRRVASLPELEARERDALAEAMKSLTARYDNLFQTSFPYSMGWHGRPTDGEEHPWWRLHAVYFPPLLRSASVRKFLVGYELTGEPQRDLTAEQAADRLRATSDRHYREE
jgi:UDPglucose--hexose-1-phosphate uridylyltransferase